MKKKKVALEREFNVFYSENLKISYSDRKYLFEIGNEITNDLSEAVSILMRSFRKDDEIWKLEILSINIEDLEPAKALYWLTGGKEEWDELNNYKKYWHECLLDFQEEFGWTIVEIINYSKTLGDIRESFLKNLNLPILYNFALSKDIA